MSDIRTQIFFTRARAEYTSELPEPTDAKMHKANANMMERMFAVVEAAKDVYEWADPSSELQQVEMLLLHDAINAVQPEQKP